MIYFHKTTLTADDDKDYFVCKPHRFRRTYDDLVKHGTPSRFAPQINCQLDKHA